MSFDCLERNSDKVVNRRFNREIDQFREKRENVRSTHCVDDGQLFGDESTRILKKETVRTVFGETLRVVRIFSLIFL